uniref:Uncharacterized protein n=1 Tax=Lygus hesperus TaxID=30085 RepID=A0A0A9X0C5_LYGHE
MLHLLNCTNPVPHSASTARATLLGGDDTLRTLRHLTAQGVTLSIVSAQYPTPTSLRSVCGEVTALRLSDLFHCAFPGSLHSLFSSVPWSHVSDVAVQTALIFEICCAQPTDVFVYQLTLHQVLRILPPTSASCRHGVIVLSVAPSNYSITLRCGPLLSSLLSEYLRRRPCYTLSSTPPDPVSTSSFFFSNLPDSSPHYVRDLNQLRYLIMDGAAELSIPAPILTHLLFYRDFWITQHPVRVGCVGTVVLCNYNKVEGIAILVDYLNYIHNWFTVDAFLRSTCSTWASFFVFHSQPRLSLHCPYFPPTTFTVRLNPLAVTAVLQPSGTCASLWDTVLDLLSSRLCTHCLLRFQQRLVRTSWPTRITFLDDNVFNLLTVFNQFSSDSYSSPCSNPLDSSSPLSPPPLYSPIEVHTLWFPPSRNDLDSSHDASFPHTIHFLRSAQSLHSPISNSSLSPDTTTDCD